MNPNAAFAIGIDLGTSNSALASVDLSESGAESQTLPLAQEVAEGMHDHLNSLPSFLYFAPDGAESVGTLARGMAGTQPDRVAHSAKSWLCHPWVDREGKLLPWQSESVPPAQRLSPVEVSTRFLRHLRACWETEHPDAPLAEQQVVLTVPASFDPAAQQLTLEAAQAAGFPESTFLLEEPQAAFTRWMERNTRAPGHWQPAPDGSRVLVCDIGGGTTDFSLFSVTVKPGEPSWTVRRLAVSDHVLLGGDNIDRWLALQFREELERGGERLSTRQWGFLLAESRKLKEALLTEGTEGEVAAVPSSIALPASGSGLFAEQRQVQVDGDALREGILESFYPRCDAAARPEQAKAGLRVVGLPYARDGAVTRHLAAFLADRGRVDAVLFNGGSLLADRVRRRLLDTLASWQDGIAPVELHNPEADLAVARGAAAYGAHLARHQTPIEGGSARALYLEVLDRKTREHSLICILPMGTPPQQSITVEDRHFTALVDTPVRFQVYSSTQRDEDAAGDVVPLEGDAFHPLPAMQSMIRVPAGAPKPANQQVKVQVEAHLTAGGLLKVFLVSAEKAWRGKGRWELLFNLRAPTLREQSDELTDSPRLEKARGAVLEVFGKRAGNDPRAARHLARTLETLLQRPRKDWDRKSCRGLWPALEEGITRRDRSADHETAWLSLAGYVLRPGFGAEMDEFRIPQLWRLHELGLCFPRAPRNKNQLWILWRRVAGGLDGARQELLADAWLGPLLSTGAHEPELIRLAGALERLPLPRKLQFMEGMLRMLEAKNPQSAAYAWSLGRMLSRIPFGGGPESVLPPAQVEEAFARLRDTADWSLPELRAAFLQGGRLTEEPGLNCGPAFLNRLAAHLEQHGGPTPEFRFLREVIPPEEADRTRLFGESLPAGLMF